jgi:adenylate cyclase
LFTLEDFNLIGRSHDATIRVEDAGISRQHATIRREGKLFWLTDLGSANGSYVNDVAVSTARVLRTGDRIQFGTSLFIFDHEDGDTTREITGANQTQMLSTVSLPVKTIAITLLVGDLRDFTKISAQLSAEEVAAMLREWYADCEAILKPRGAIIDKFMGDGVFAYWPQVDHATRERATESAKLLCRAVGSHSPTRKRLQDNMGINVQCNVGLNIGEVALGAMGRGVNTAVGEAVNVTFRIESLTRKLDTPVLASAAFVHGWPQAASHYTHAGIHPVKGQPDPVEVYSLIGA